MNVSHDRLSEQCSGYRSISREPSEERERMKSKRNLIPKNTKSTKETAKKPTTRNKKTQVIEKTLPEARYKYVYCTIK